PSVVGQMGHLSWQMVDASRPIVVVSRLGSHPTGVTCAASHRNAIPREFSRRPRARPARARGRAPGWRSGAPCRRGARSRARCRRDGRCCCRSTARRRRAPARRRTPRGQVISGHELQGRARRHVGRLKISRVRGEGHSVPPTRPCDARGVSSTAAVALTVLCTVVSASPAAADDDHRGWRYLVAKLEADGVPAAEVVAAFGDPRVPRFDGLYFSLAPREPAALYRALLRPASVVQARRCRDRWTAALADAERWYGVPASVVAAILHVESGCGHYTGRSLLLPGLARLAMANEPANVDAYIDAVLTIARRIDTRESAPTALAHRSVKRHVVAARRPAHRPPHHRAHHTAPAHPHATRR